jgi:hypothetical protein
MQAIRNIPKEEFWPGHRSWILDQRKDKIYVIANDGK